MTNKMNFTPEQTKAITTDFPGNALVSASAGSGKTRVLVERVLDKINRGVDVDQLLIVTFTKAASKEMRDRIKAALQKELNETKDEEKKRNLISQIRKLSVAHISTMDAFCQWLVQKYYYAIDLDPNFRLLTDRTETEMLRDSVWSDLREELYSNDEDGSFAKLTRNFSSDRNDDGLTEIVLGLYNFSQVKQNPNEWLSNLSSMYHVDGSLTESLVYKKYLLPEIQNNMKQVLNSLEQARQISDTAGFEKVTDTLKSDIVSLNKLYDDLTSLGWDALYEEFNNLKFARMPGGKLPDDEKKVKDNIKDIRNRAKRQFTGQIVERCFYADEETNVHVLSESEKLVKRLVEVVYQFSEQYSQVKAQKHAYEFIDVEHFALNILTNDNETSRQIKQRFQNYFNEIMVDEYQDNNRLQDAILTALKNPERGNMFMVGDVKQSIYRFRLADPSMFLTKLEDYQKDDNSNSSVVLADNFRSAENVDDFTNLIFTQIMNKQLGEMNYTGDAKLKFGASYPDELKSNVEIMLYADASDNPEGEDTKLNVETNAEGQVEMVAQKIQQLVDQKFQVYDKKLGKMRDIKFGDIAILAPTRHNNLNISKTFAEHRIPVTLDGAQSYFKTTEVQIMISLLQIIDNPYQDIPLAAVLRSPIVGMDENEMAYLRINRHTEDYFASLLHFYNSYPNEKPTDFGTIVYKKVDLFLKQLTDFKDFAVKHELSDLIWHIYEETGFLDYVGGMPAGDKRVANLHALYERAAEYEKNSFKGLFAFVQFVKRLQNGGEDLAEAPGEINPNSVNVMTIHGSKGLEFPVVILMDATHHFNKSDIRNPFIFNDKLGVGIKYYDTKSHVLMQTLPYLAVSNVTKNQMLSEDMRQLYVALTRAEQQIFITGIAKDKDPEKAERQKWEKAFQSSNLVLDQSERSSADSFMDWIGMALSRHQNYGKYSGLLRGDHTRFNIEFVDPDDLVVKQKTTCETADEVNSGQAHSIDDEEIKQIMDFEYPYKAATTTTAYQSVSEIKRLFDDPDNIQLGSVSESRNMILKRTRYNSGSFAQPKFMQSVERPSSMAVGTATHLVLQKIDVRKPITEESVNELIEKLVKQKLITPEVAKEIKVDRILNFFESSLGKLILANPDKLHREVPFSLIIPAGQIFKDFANDKNQKLLVHGIIDGYLDLEDGTVLFDYKTDFINPKHQAESIKKISDSYRGQLNIYAIALDDMLDKPVQAKYLYMLSGNHLQKIE